MKKAVFFDIDGTLWDEHMQIPPSTISAIRQLKENGHYAFLCSGRSRAAICAAELLSGIGFDGIIAACGTYIEYLGDVIYERAFLAEELDALMECFDRQKQPLILEGRGGLYADMEYFHENEYIIRLKEFLGKGFLTLAEHKEKRDASKATSYYGGEDLETVKAELAKHFDLIFHTEVIFEIVPKGFSKATGIRRICDYLNVAHEDTYAFGDGPNDIEMLTYVRHGIAMGNGAESAKKAADYVTAPLWEDGIQKGLQHFSLI